MGEMMINEETQQRFEYVAYSLIQRYKEKMNLQAYDIKLVYVNDTDCDPMTIEVFYPYHNVEIYYNDKAILRWHEGLLDWLIRHEMCHIPLWNYMAMVDELVDSYDCSPQVKDLLDKTMENAIDSIAVFKVW